MVLEFSGWGPHSSPMQLLTSLPFTSVAQLQYPITHTVTQMITNHFNAICSFFFFQGFRKLIDTNRRARKFESKDKLEASEPEHMLPTTTLIMCFRGRKYCVSVIDLFPVTSRKLCQHDPQSLASAQDFHHTLNQTVPGSRQPCTVVGLTTAMDKDAALTNHKYQLEIRLYSSDCQAEGLIGVGRAKFHFIREAEQNEGLLDVFPAPCRGSPSS